MNGKNIIVRVAQRGDASAIAAIYAPIVRDTAISFEAEPPSAEEMTVRIENTLQSHPWLVAVREDEVLGYAYASQHRQRAAYQWSVDVTVYVAATARREGVGRKLYSALKLILRAQGFRSAFAGIALPNDGSVHLHEAIGFVALGVYSEVGFKLDQWRDVGWWRLALTEGDDFPTEPIPFARFRLTSACAAIVG